MSLIKAERWLGTHPLFLWTDIINYTSFHRGSGFAYNIGLQWEPDDMFASNKLCLLISIQSVSRGCVRRYTSRSVITDPRAAASLLRVANGGPAAAHVWRGSSGFWEPSHKGPELGHTAPMRQEDVVMRSPLAGVVQKPHPQDTGGARLKMIYKRFWLARVVGL